MTRDDSTVRYKVAPEPRNLGFLRDAQAAIPLVPDSVDDCCARLLERTAVSDRGDAREYITFFHAVELIAETPRGYERRRVEVDREALADTFERRVFGVAELLAAFEATDDGDTGELSVDEAFESLREDVPEWERGRHVDWEREWRERTERLLEWAEIFGLVVEVDGAYRRELD